MSDHDTSPVPPAPAVSPATVAQIPSVAGPSPMLPAGVGQRALQRRIQRRRVGGGADGGTATDEHAQASTPAPTGGGTTPGSVNNAPRDPAATVERLRHELQRLRNYTSGEIEGHRRLTHIRYDSLTDRAVGRIAETYGGAGRLPPLSMWDDVNARVEEANHALAAYQSSHDAADLTRVHEATSAAGRAFQACQQRLTLYRERTEDGANAGVEALHGIQAVCATVAALCAAPAAISAVGATGGAALVTGAAASGAVAGGVVVANGAGEALGHLAAGDGEHVDWSRVLAQAETTAVHTFVSGLAGGVLGEAFGVVVSRALGPSLIRLGGQRLGPLLAQYGSRVIANFLSGAGLHLLERAVRVTFTWIRTGQHPNRQQFLDRVGHELLAAGGAGLQQAIMGELMHHAQAAPSTGARNNAAGEAPARPRNLGPGTPDPVRPRTDPSEHPVVGHTPWNETVHAVPGAGGPRMLTASGETPPRWRDPEGNWHFPSEPGRPVTRAQQDVALQEGEQLGSDLAAINRLNAAHEGATEITNRTYQSGANRGESAMVGPHDQGLAPGVATPRRIDDRLQIASPSGEVASHRGGALPNEGVRRAAPEPGETVGRRLSPDNSEAPLGSGHVISGNGRAVVRVGTDNRSVLEPSTAPARPDGRVPDAVAREVRERIVREEIEGARAAGEDPESTTNVNFRERVVETALRRLGDEAQAAQAAHDTTHGQTVEATRVVQHTTGISSCGGLAVRGTRGGNETYRSLTHAAAENATTQYERLQDEVGSALRGGAEDVRAVATIDPRARMRPAEDSPGYINDRYHNFPSQAELPSRMASDLQRSNPDFEFRADGESIVARPRAGGPERRIHLRVEEAAVDTSHPNGRNADGTVNRAAAPEDRTMTVTSDGVVIRSQQTGQRTVIPWSRVSPRGR